MSEPEKSTVCWYCVRTQPKHEHIAAAHLRRNCGLEVFAPRLRIRKATRRGAVWFIESLFPGYIFARFDWAGQAHEVRGGHGVSTLVTFGSLVPVIPQAVIEALRAQFDEDELHEVADPIKPGDVVTIAGGAFHGLDAVVLRVMEPNARVQVLLDILGGETPVEIPMQNVAVEAPDGRRNPPRKRET